MRSAGTPMMAMRTGRWLSAASQARVAFHLPYLGYGLAILSEKRVRMLVIGLPALLIALSALASLWRDSTPEGRPQSA